MARLFQIQCGVQSYDWGKIGSSSAVAQFADASDPSFTVDETKPYAELWMGTHPKVPSVNSKGETLRDIVAGDESLLGKDVVAKFGPGELPFLFKVLSIEKALSIQAHPDKTLGAILHKNDPKNYPDGNHKPEMAIAVTEFEGFCGFRPLEQITEMLKTVPSLVELVGADVADSFIQKTASHEHAKEGSEDDKNNRKSLQELFGHLMRSSDDAVSAAAEKLIKQAKEQPSTLGGSAGGNDLAKLILRLNEQFPLDIGLFCGGLLLNYVQLNPGEAMFLRAKDPHAYISGNIIECMAASDNVVRAGFTPKFKDVDNLVSMLTYSYAPVIEQKMKPLEFERASGAGTKSTLYDPPISEFAVLESVVDQGATVDVKPIDGPSIIIVTEGEGSISDSDNSLDIKTGYVFFVGANDEVKITSTKGKLTSYRAFCEVEK